MLRVVLDSNVLVAGLRSRRGASFRVLTLVDGGAFVTVVTVPLVIEYERVLLDSRHAWPHRAGDVRAVLDYLCAVSEHKRVHFLWRPCLPDANDDMVLEAAVTGNCTHIVTFNVKDFVGCERFGVQALTPGAFLGKLGEKR